MAGGHTKASYHTDQKSITEFLFTVANISLNLEEEEEERNNIKSYDTISNLEMFVSHQWRFGTISIPYQSKESIKILEQSEIKYGEKIW